MSKGHSCVTCGRALQKVKPAAIAVDIDISTLSEKERFAYYKATAPLLDLRFYLAHAKEGTDSPVWPTIEAMAKLALTLGGPVATQKRLVWAAIDKYKAACARQPGYWDEMFTQEQLDAETAERRIERGLPPLEEAIETVEVDPYEPEDDGSSVEDDDGDCPV